MQTEGGIRHLEAADGERELPSDAARKRAAVELIRSDERTLRRTARRYSVCDDDAEDAYQRALEILLTKAPTDDPRELIRWMQTVTKHEALAVRRQRERLLGAVPSRADDDHDWLELIPSQGDGPADLAERRECVARCREALQTLKPTELRALTLLAEGFSYAEIEEHTGWSYTKINRNLAEGRQRFRRLLSSSETGERCDQMSSLMSAYCDGETQDADTRAVREHLRVCAYCRATMRAYRAVPKAAAALGPALPISRSLLGRTHEALAGLHSRFAGRGRLGDTTLGPIAASGGTRGGGLAVLAKVLAVCAGTAGGAAACVAAGVVPPIEVSKHHERQPAIVKESAQVRASTRVEAAPQEPEPPTNPTPVSPTPEPEPTPVATPDPTPAVATEPTPAPVSAPPPPPTVEFTPEAASAPVTSAPAATSTPSSSSSSSGAGEFGP